VTTPQKIVCLSAEAADWLWRIGAWEQVAGVTAFFDQPADSVAKPRISGFSTAKLDEIEKLEPDLIIAFSDVQAELVAGLMRRGLNVLGTNQRTLSEIEATLALLGRLVDRELESERWLTEFRAALSPSPRSAFRTPLRTARPRVYFEEWNEPLTSGIAWVSELIERAGGEDIFSDRRSKRSAADRRVSPDLVVTRNPEVILVSWCGRPMRKEEITSRPGWDNVAAVRNGRIHEIRGEDILQPGFRLVFGYERIKELLFKD